MRTRKKARITDEDFRMIKRLRAGGASTREIVELTGLSDSVVWNVDRSADFAAYHQQNAARAKAQQLNAARRKAQNEKKTEDESIEQMCFTEAVTPIRQDKTAAILDIMLQKMEELVNLIKALKGGD